MGMLGSRVAGRWLRPTMCVALIVPASIGVASCRSNMLPALRQTASHVDTLATSQWRPREYPLPRPSTWPSESQIAAEADRLAGVVSDVPTEDQRAVVAWSCEVADGVEAAYGTPADIANYLATRFDTPYSYRLQIETLADDLMEAGDDFELAAVLGRVTLCEWATY